MSDECDDGNKRRVILHPTFDLTTTVTVRGTAAEMGCSDACSPSVAPLITRKLRKLAWGGS